jgi:predicted permease
MLGLATGRGAPGAELPEIVFRQSGLEKASVLELNLAPRPGAYQNLDVNDYHRQLLERISNFPGVDSVSFSDATMNRAAWQDNAAPVSEAPSLSSGIMANAATVAPGFFRTLGISLVRGRDFDWNDDEHHPHVAILSSSLAARLFPSGDAVGQRIRFSFMPETQNLEVIGVANNARFLDLHNASPSAVYLPVQQFTPGPCQQLFVRTGKAPEALARAIENEVNSLGRDYSLGARTIDQEVGQALVEDRAISMLSSFFGGLALLLASIGLYGLMSYSVSRRTREIGVRAALGAQRTTVIWLVLHEALALVLLGVAVGIPFALAASRLIASMLFEISPGDLPTIAAVSLLLLASALVAGYVPAVRASRTDPVVALRTE